MIKIFDKFYIHWMFIFVGAFCYITRNLEAFLISYFIMSIHELSHFFAAKTLGLSCSYVAVYPFGLNLRLNNTLLFGVLDEIILYLSGPLSNILMALFALPFIKNNLYAYDFYIKNIAFFILNLLPVIPLDGGMVFNKAMVHFFGYKRGRRYTNIISVLICIVLIFLSLCFIYLNSPNPSLCIFASFILGNVFFSKEKYNTTLLKELLYSKKKKNINKPYHLELIGADERVEKVEIAKEFKMSRDYLVVLTDKNKKVKKIITEDEIIDGLLE